MVAVANESRIYSAIIALLGGFFITTLTSKIDKLETEVQALRDRERENIAEFRVLKSEFGHLTNELAESNTALKEINGKLVPMLLGR